MKHKHQTFKLKNWVQLKGKTSKVIFRQHPELLQGNQLSVYIRGGIDSISDITKITITVVITNIPERLHEKNPWPERFDT